MLTGGVGYALIRSVLACASLVHTRTEPSDSPNASASADEENAKAVIKAAEGIE